MQQYLRRYLVCGVESQDLRGIPTAHTCTKVGRHTHKGKCLWEKFSLE